MRPIQPISKDKNGVTRFEENKIVQFLLDRTREHGIDLNLISRMNFSQEDREQFAQLIGYSVSGFGELDYVKEETYNTVCNMVEEGIYEEEARIKYLQETLDSVKEKVRELSVSLFNIHEDNLRD